MLELARGKFDMEIQYALRSQDAGVGILVLQVTSCMNAVQ